MQMIIQQRRDTADGVLSLTLGRTDGGRLPAWTPGAHVEVVLDNGITRQYSLCSDPGDDRTWRVGILREPESRGGSKYVFDKLHDGDIVEVGEPRNHFELESAPGYVFVAGGIGITPILPMIAQAERAGAEWTLLYGGRTRSSMAFLDELAPYGDRVTIAPQDEAGLLDLAGLLATPRRDTLVYACGPEPLLDAVAERTTAWPAGTLRVERFTPPDPRTRRGRRLVRGRVRDQRPHGHRARRCEHPVRRRGRRHHRRLVVPGGHLRQLRDTAAGRAGRAP